MSHRDGWRAPAIRHHPACGDSDGSSRFGRRRVLEGREVKVSYDTRTDTLHVVLRDQTAVHESDEARPGVILDFDDPTIKGASSHSRYSTPRDA
jgi:hypothetical protein